MERSFKILDEVEADVVRRISVLVGDYSALQ